MLTRLQLPILIKTNNTTTMTTYKRMLLTEKKQVLVLFLQFINLLLESRSRKLK